MMSGWEEREWEWREAGNLNLRCDERETLKRGMLNCECEVRERERSSVFHFSFFLIFGVMQGA